MATERKKMIVPHKPALWTTLSNDNDEDSIVVPEGTDAMEAFLTLIQEVYGGEKFAPDNPVIVAAFKREQLRVQRWHYCSKAQVEAEGWADTDFYEGWWSPEGDGATTIHVLAYPGSAYVLAEEAEAAETLAGEHTKEGE